MSITSSAEDASSGHAEHQATVEIDHVTKHFGDDVAVDDANFAIEEGGMRWFDTMTIPRGARNVMAAARWMNYVYEPEVAAKITEWVQFISPVRGVKEVLLMNGGEAAALADNPLVFPDEAMTSRLKVFGDLLPDDEDDIQTRVNEITG